LPKNCPKLLQKLFKPSHKTIAERGFALNETNETTEDLKKTINDLETKREELEREVYRLQMQKDILEKAGEIIKKGKGIHPEKLSNREKADLIDALRKSIG